jgi:serine O-acetyltransferase
MFRHVVMDVRAARERDPAARSSLEILLTYSGLHAIWYHRVNHRLWRHGFRLIARLGSQWARFLTGIEIHPGATIGDGFFIDHGMGVVIGETTEIGRNVTLFQGVTLGGTGKEQGKRHPTVRDNVVVGVGAKILGGIEIGENSKIGANAVVLNPVPPNSTAVGVPARIVLLEGERVDVIDLHHERMPDPVAEMFKTLTHRVDRVQRRVEACESCEKASEVSDPADKGTEAGE